MPDRPFTYEKRRELAKKWNSHVPTQAKFLAHYFDCSEQMILAELARGNVLYDGSISFQEISIWELRSSKRIKYDPDLAQRFSDYFKMKRPDLEKLTLQLLVRLDYYLNTLKLSPEKIVMKYPKEINVSAETIRTYIDKGYFEQFKVFRKVD